jgi:S-adenosylmethionine:tRNA ribosyltransferase-isomerase
MLSRDFDYVLPPDRIAQTPIEPRDAARLMVIDRASDAIAHHHVRDLDALLAPGDLLVANDTRVIHARLHARKAPGGGAVEVLLLHPVDEVTWQALVRGRVRIGSRLEIGAPAQPALSAEVLDLGAGGVRTVRFAAAVEPLLDRLGDVPLPPYIRVPLTDAERYQTVYARIAGSAAAPTAGLHFTPALLDRLAGRGIGLAMVTLHVGLDTFRPLETDRIEDHVIHREWCTVPAATVDAVRRARSGRRRVVAVGTTTVRALETAARDVAPADVVAPFAGWTDLYITPGHAFRAVDALMTNFHLPRSTLLLLVAAFAGKTCMDRAYADAIAGDYRFYSFGDAMLIG